MMKQCEAYKEVRLRPRITASIACGANTRRAFEIAIRMVMRVAEQFFASQCPARYCAIRS